MTEIRFYHLQRTSLERALPELLEKCHERSWHAVVMAGSEERAESLTQHLWTYHDRSFLPHGNARDGSAELQPIWLTAMDENPNDATVLFLVDGARSYDVSGYDLVCEVFDGNSDEAVAAARDRWADYRKDGHTLAYWRQGDTGWEQKQTVVEGGSKVG